MIREIKSQSTSLIIAFRCSNKIRWVNCSLSSDNIEMYLDEDSCIFTEACFICPACGKEHTFQLNMFSD